MGEKEECFVIMPISDPEGYEPGHFRRVYEDIVRPACETAGYTPVRADDAAETNFITLDVLKRLLETPMAVCDLSARNPNVLYELGVRQAFDMPVTLIQEKGTKRIFDIAPLRCTDYRRGLLFREVPEDQKSIAKAIQATKEATSKGDGINSLVTLLSLTAPAALKDARQVESSPMLEVVRAEISELRREVREGIHRQRMDISVPEGLRIEQNEMAKLNFFRGRNVRIVEKLKEPNIDEGELFNLVSACKQTKAEANAFSFGGSSEGVKSMAIGVANAAEAIETSLLKRIEELRSNGEAGCEENSEA